jgi:hypothetical protein
VFFALWLIAQGFFVYENPTLDVGFKRAYSGEEAVKNPFDIIMRGLPK